MKIRIRDFLAGGSRASLRRVLLTLTSGCLALLLVPRLAAATVSYAAAPTTFSWISTATQTLVVAGSSGGTWSGGAACSAGTYDNATPDDDITWQVPLGFTFNYAGTPYTQVQIDANGRLQFNNGACGFGGPFIQIPTTTGNTVNTPTTTIIPYILDFDPGNPTNFPGENTTCAPPGCGVFYGTETTSGGMQYFVVTWYNVPESGQGPCPGCLVFSVQAILYSNGTFAFQYQNNSSDPPTDSNGNLPAIGWVVNTTGNYYNYPYIANINNTNNITALNNTAILFGPNLLDHFAISAPAYGSTCPSSPSGQVPVTITAEDALNNIIPNYTGLVTITVSSGNQTANLTVNQANGTLSFLGYDPNTGYPQWSYQFVAADAGGIVLNLSDTSGETVNVTLTDFGTGISSTSANIRFQGGTLVVANATGEIPVPVAGRQQKMTVTRYNGCNIATGFNSKNQKMTVWLTLDPSQPAGAALPGVTGNATQTPTAVSTLPTSKPGSFNIRLTFSKGVADFTLNTSDVGKYLLNWCQGNGNTCGSAPITVIPFGLAVVVPGNPHQTSVTQTPPFAKAGSNFSATVTAYLWNAAQDTNNDGIPDPGADITGNPVLIHFSWPVTLAASAPFVPSGGTLGTLNNGVLNVVNGTGSANNLQYSEVGSTTLTATAANYLNTPGVNATGNSSYDGSNGYVGRFYPDHFDVSYVDGCNTTPGVNYTYSGQPFTTVMVTAMNAYGDAPADVTHNYDGSLGFAQPVTISEPAPTVGAFTSNTIAAGNFIAGVGTGTSASSPIVYTFTNKETAPSNVILRATDPDSASSAGHIEPSAPILSGRVHLLGAVGSELLDLPLPLYLEAFQGPDSGWQVNAHDTCTTLAASDFSLSYLPGGLPGGTTSIKSVSLTNGQGNVTLAAPGTGNTGDVDVAGSGIPAWLQYDWQSSGTLADPAARASFGVYQGDSHQIYIQVIH